MARAFLLIRLTLVLVGLAVSAAAPAGGANPGDSSPKATNTFNMITHGRSADTRASSRLRRAPAWRRRRSSATRTTCR